MSDFSELREEVAGANRALERAGLVVLSFGNASGSDRARSVMAIKPSGIACAEVTADEIVVIDIDSGAVVEGTLRPSSDTPTHLALYRRYPSVGGVVHTHSRYAGAWAQAELSIPCLGTTHADHFHGTIPVTRQLTAEEIDGEYELATGNAIVEALDCRDLDPLEMPAALVACHGPFTWGHDAGEAVTNAIALEAVAAMALHTVALRSDVQAVARALQDRHYRRKHGPNAYYGQK